MATPEKPDLVPVLLSALVWPGAGQLYSGQRRKGVVLVAVSLLVVLAFCVVVAVDLARGLLANLPAFEAAPAGFAWQVLAGDARVVLGGLLVIGVWVYSVIDAYRGARLARRP